MVKSDQTALDEELTTAVRPMEQLALHCNQKYYLAVLLVSFCGVIVVAAIALGFYVILPASVLSQQPTELRPASEPVEEDVGTLGKVYFKAEAHDVLVGSLHLLELMEKLDPLVQQARYRRDLSEQVPNRISQDDRSEEITYGVRRRVQREFDLGTVPVAYRNVRPERRSRLRRAVGVPVELEELQRAKRSAEKDFRRLEKEYHRCRKEAPNGKLCDQIYEKFQRLSDEVNARFTEMANLLQGLHDPHGTDQSGTEHEKASSTEWTPVSRAQGSEMTTFVMQTTTELPDVTMAFDLSQHLPVENSSIRSLDDLFDHLRLSDPFAVTSTEMSSESVEVMSQSSTNPPTTVTMPKTTNPTTKRTTTRSPLQAARNLHDVVDQLQLAQMIQPHPFHEDLLHNPPSADIDDFVMARSRNRGETQHDQKLTPASQGSDSGPLVGRQDVSIDPMRSAQYHPLVVGPSAPFLNLCDQLRSANSGGQLTPPVHSNGFQQVHSNAPGIPITGEATKASSQIIVNSAYGGGYVPNTVCFYQNAPPAYSFRPAYQTYPQGGYSQPHHAGGKLPLNDPSVDALIQPRAPAAMINMPVSIQNLHHPGAPRVAGDDPNASASGPVLLCSMVHAAEQPQHDQRHHTTNTNPTNDTHAPEDDLTAMFAAGHSSAARAKGRHHCRRGWVPCFSSHQCVKRANWCDSKTDCLDGSDESACSCVSRLPSRKLCDGYADCPLGMDEMGCFGCDRFAFSCFHTAAEHSAASHRAARPLCYTLHERCDGFDHCLNRKDEQDCAMLVRDMGHYLAYSVPHSVGVLHRNFRGKWYPVCHNPVQWAREACESELGPQLGREPQVSHGHGSLPGPYISQRATGVLAEPEFSDTCNGVYVHVRCPPVRCGTSRLHEQHAARISVRTRRNVTEDELVESVRIVGGSQAEPEAYPFIVGIFRDGKFHCGGSIYNEHWIISAAHCCDNFDQHYFEVRSGMLRKRSFAPQVQITRVTHMIIHHAYSSALMANDIALMRVEHPFLYNRWVRPICLPERHRTTDDRDWMWGPKAGTICTAVGWGALRERGGAPDALMQVSVPILATCKHRADRDSLQICAAEEDGGHDACQGDSGGPFVCQSKSNPFEWYLAGVVSHGEGCARPHEPGVYTRVALFIEWIAQKVKDPLPSRTARSDCPGMRCIWGGGICLPPGKKCNGYVNCLGGEDESGCEMDLLLRSMAQRESTDSEGNEDQEANDSQDGTEHQDNEAITANVVLSEESTPVVDEGTTPQSLAQSTTLQVAEATFTTREASGEAQESMIVTQVMHTEPQTSTTPVVTSPEVESISSITTTEQDLTSTVAVSEGTSTMTQTTSLESSSSISESSSSTTVSSWTTTSVSTTTDSAIVFPESETHQSTSGFEFIAPVVSTTTEAIWKVLEKTIQEVRGQVRSKNETETKDPMAPVDVGDESTVPTDVEGSSEDHPFFGELDVMHQAKQKRVAQFRLTVHNLHTKSNAPVLLPNDTAQYRQFSCTNITQRINVAHRCDRIVDCEDGSDEQNCTCRDFLKDKFDFLICDGKTDCLDHTDEKDCMDCHAGQYACRISQVCVPREQVCNGHPDCPLHEDELDCLALTDGHRVYFDANNLTLFRNTGIVTKNTNGTWEVLCGAVLTAKTEHAIEKICSFLGFAGYRNYSLLTLTPGELPAGLLVNAGDQPYVNLTVEAGCQALRVSCAQHINATEHDIAHFEHQHNQEPVQVNIRPVNPIHRPHHMPQIVFQENAHIELVENFGDDYDWPWNADIYLDGVLICSGLIIDSSWIIVASSCTRMVNLRHQYIAVVAGGAKSYLHIAGPYEQVGRVDCYHFIPEAETVMLHLASPLTFSRHVLPTFVPESDNLTDSECLAVGQDKYGRTKTLRVHLNSTDCGGERVRCYHKDLKQPYYHHESCYTPEATRSGVIVCKTSRSGWYPVGFYQNKRGLCGFNEVVRVTSLVESYQKIQDVLRKEQCGVQQYEEPPCAGKRCRYGKCVGERLLCDRKPDCSDGSDEDPVLCAARNHTSNCLAHQMRCANGRCIDKSNFCDRKNDCGDSTDEPHDCSCYTYLKITDPGKICDGVRNCWDKSDENPRVCRCHPSSFRCGESDICVPYDFVCDKERDCPDGEDELYCYALQQNSYEAGYGELMEQSYGIWRSKCFPKTAQFDDEYMRRICEQLGYNQVRKIYGRAIVEGTRLRTANETESAVDKLRRAATKTIVQNKFSKVVINDNHTFYMKPSRPMFKLINWNDEDQQHCHRLELLCAP